VNARARIHRPSWMKTSWFKRTCTVLIVLLALRMLILIVPWMLDLKTLRREMELWANQSLRNTAPVSIGSIDFAVNLMGTGKLWLHDLEIEAPNQIEFDHPLLTVGRIKALAPISGILGISRCTPLLECKDIDLRLEWNADGECNIDHFLSPLDEPKPAGAFPLLNFRAADADLSLRRLRFRLEHPELAAALMVQLKGKLHLKPSAKTDGTTKEDAATHTGKIRDIVVEGQFEPTELTGYPAGAPFIHLPSFRIRIPEQPQDIHWSRAIESLVLTVRELPLKLVGLLLPKQLRPETNMRLDGKINVAAGRIAVEGTIKGLDLPSFDIQQSSPLRLHANPQENGMLCTLELGKSTSPALTAAFSITDEKTPLALTTEFCNFDQLSTLDTIWKRLRPGLQSVSVNAKRLRIFDTDIQDATAILSIGDAEKSGDPLTIQAVFSDGSLLCKTDMWRPTSDKIETIPWTIQLNEVSLSALQSELRLPWLQLIGLSPEATGKGTVNLSPVVGDKNTEDNTPLQNRWQCQIAFTNVIVPLSNSGSIWRELASIPEGLQETESLRRKALNLQEPPAPPASLPKSIRFTSINVALERFEDGAVRIQSVVGLSPELGTIVGGGQSLADGSFRLALTLQQSSTPVDRPILSDEINKAIAQISEREGLRIDFLITVPTAESPATTTPARKYVESIFKLWTEEQAKQQAASAEAAKAGQTSLQNNTEPEGPELSDHPPALVPIQPKDTPSASGQPQENTLKNGSGQKTDLAPELLPEPTPSSDLTAPQKTQETTP